MAAELRVAEIPNRLYVSSIWVLEYVYSREVPSRFP